MERRKSASHLYYNTDMLETARSCALNLKWCIGLEENLSFIIWRLTLMSNFHFKCAKARFSTEMPSLLYE